MLRLDHAVRAARRGLTAIACLMATLAPGAAAAQIMPFLGPPAGIPAERFNPAPPPPVAPGGSFGLPPARTTQGQRNEPHATLPQPPAGKVALGAFARFGADGPPIPRGVQWRVFADTPEASGAFPLVAESSDPYPVFFLDPGGYIFHVSYGLAVSAQRVQVGSVSRREAFNLPAGGLRLQADVDDKPIPGQKVAFDIYEGSFLQGRASSQPYYRGANAGEVVLLPEGTYHVVSTYGDANAVVRADVTVQAGKLTDATVHHRAAQVTLKLVSQKGGDALPDTQWTVTTPGGDTIKESIGAFPVFVLTEGDYVAFARKDGRTISREFKVEAGKDQEVEVITR
ncbi:hypothetical protein J5J86_21605 [Aquabacter sp. L1I39]|uniref:hypothetical protein n=1 Tax=Aquabacter sp. L1I39 TaxID=2820278 RepID=UPI001ADCA2D8|nr:hypothetical protein [Aquabacter sp. L1I39]QTL03307.1 hypothetical protein J5J86_21605 [Aquabacter sp. L1I39]